MTDISFFGVVNVATEQHTQEHENEKKIYVRTFRIETEKGIEHITLFSKDNKPLQIKKGGRI